MIQGKIQDQLDIPGMAQGDELLQILQGPEGGAPDLLTEPDPSGSRLPGFCTRTI